MIKGNKGSAAVDYLNRAQSQMTVCLKPDKFAIINEEERACVHEIHSAKTQNGALII